MLGTGALLLDLGVDRSQNTNCAPRLSRQCCQIRTISLTATLILLPLKSGAVGSINRKSSPALRASLVIFNGLSICGSDGKRSIRSMMEPGAQSRITDPSSRLIGIPSSSKTGACTPMNFACCSERSTTILAGLPPLIFGSGKRRPRSAACRCKSSFVTTSAKIDKAQSVQAHSEILKSVNSAGNSRPSHPVPNLWWLVRKCSPTHQNDECRALSFHRIAGSAASYNLGDGVCNRRTCSKIDATAMMLLLEIASLHK